MDQPDIVVRQGLHLRAWTIRSIKAVRWGNVTLTRMVGVSVGGEDGPFHFGRIQSELSVGHSRGTHKSRV